jgi:hypothetical protein
MAFKIKDLMINVAPADDGGQGCWANSCGFLTELGCAGKSGCTVTAGAVFCPNKSGCTVTAGDFCPSKSGCTVTAGDFCPSKSGCTVTAGAFCAGKSGCTVTAQGFNPEEVLKELKDLKAQLQQALEAVDKDIKTVEDGMKPQTIEEVEELQSKLKEALEELDKRKAELDKK